MAKKTKITHPSKATEPPEPPAHSPGLSEADHDPGGALSAARVETFRIGEMDYKVMEHLPDGILLLRWESEPKARTGIREHKDFHYNPSIKRKVVLDSDKWIPAKGIIIGQKIGPRKKSEKKRSVPPSPVRKAAPASAPVLEPEMIRLTHKAKAVLEEFVSVAGGDRDEIMSRLAIEYLAAEIERRKTLNELVKHVSHEKLLELLAAAKKG